MSVSVEFRELFRDELNKYGGVWTGGLDKGMYQELAGEEKAALKRVFDFGVKHLRKISPVIAAEIEEQLRLAEKVAGLFKAQVNKPFKFPSEAGAFTAAWLFPGAIRYVARPSEWEPAFSSYPLNSWDLTLTEGTPVYFFGSDTVYYKASPTEGKRSMILVFNNGVVEVGSTPKIYAFYFEGANQKKLGPIALQPLVEERIDPDRLIYQYPTPLGPAVIDFSTGVKWAALPYKSGVSTIKLLGMVFYEHDLYPTLTSMWISG